MGVSSGMMPGANQFNKFGGANEMGAQGQMFKNMMQLGGGGPQSLSMDPINQMGSDSTSFAPNQFSGGAMGSSQMGNSSAQVGANLGGNTTANNMQ